jgi:hypothetical protein
VSLITAIGGLVRILSIDLVQSSYANLGIVTLEGDDTGFEAWPLIAGQLGLHGPPSPKELANCLADVCKRMKIPTV